jgi:hypothetical protein
MPDFLQPEPLGDLERILELRAQWVIPSRSAGESRWRFWMRTTEEFDQFETLGERWRDHLKVFFTLDRQGDFTLDQVIVRQIAPESDRVLIVPVGESFHGTDSLEGPPQASPIITWRSDFPGRSYRGRTYWGPIGINHMIDGGPDHDVLGTVDNFAFTMLDVFQFGPLTAFDPHFCIFSRQHDNAPDLPGRVAFVTHYTVQPYLATQRRRQRYYNPP